MAVSQDSSSNITGLINEWGAGQPDALNRLLEAAYPELHRIAARQMQSERSGHTLQCTGLLHEAYLRLPQSPDKHWKDRAHFFGFAARHMRGILVDYARARLTEKRGGGVQPVTLREADRAQPAAGVDLLDLNQALQELEKLDALQSQVVELRYFGGLSISETAEVTGVRKAL